MEIHSMGIKLKIPIIIFLVTVFVSCGGGGGGDTTEDGDDDLQPVDEGSRNPGLSGRILFIEDDTLYAMDAEDGEFYTVPNTNWRQQSNRFRYPAVTDYSFNTIEHSGSEFLGFGREVEGSYVFLQDFNGNLLWQFELPGEVLSANLSQDRRYVALFRRIGSVSSTPWLEMYTVTGELLADKQLAGRQMIWLKDSRLLYSNNRTFYFTKQTSIDDDYYLTLPDPDEGSVAEGLIGDKAISPDESQIAFTVVETLDPVSGAKGSRLYIMNMDGTGLRLLATAPNDAESNIIQPTWSPDGRWILVLAGYRPTGHVLENVTDGYRYLIPTDDQGKVYYVSNDGTEKSQEVRYFSYQNINTSQFTTKGGENVFTWIP
jgi:hypothetical protein